MKESDPLKPFLENCRVRHIPWKRVFDLLFSLGMLTFGIPLYIAIALAIKITSKGPIIFSHTRIGRGGKRFHCYKFRTMHPDAEERLKIVLAGDRRKRKEWERKQKLSDDPRVTPIGNFLRKTSLDELPQFWNVLKGDLSVVGPRPVVASEVEHKYGMKAGKILSIRPGVTGLWQVSGRSDLSYQKRVELDEFYVDRHSPLLDAKLIAKTIPKMLNTKGAY